MSTEHTKHEQILASFVQGECPNIAAQPVPLLSEDAIQILREALTTARDHRNWLEAAHITNALTLVHFHAFDLFAARREAEESLSLLRAANDVSEATARVLGNLATINYYAGEVPAALTCINDALQIAINQNKPLLHGYFWCSLASIQCYGGQYTAASQSFDQARQLFVAEGNGLGIAWQQYVQGCEQDQDQGNFDQALEKLQAALPLLREKTTPKITIEILFGLAVAYLNQGDTKNADSRLGEAERLLTEGKYHWYRPKLFQLKAQLALAEGNFKLAAQHVHRGLSMVGDHGDLRTLSPLYRLLATILQQEHSSMDSIMNALDRAMAVGRTRARRLDLALALKETGTYMKVFANRATARARGSGFLFEAEQMLTEMGLPT